MSLRRTLVFALMLGIVTPAAAHADGMIIPFYGVNFGGDSGQARVRPTDQLGAVVASLPESSSVDVTCVSDYRINVTVVNVVGCVHRSGGTVCGMAVSSPR